MVGKIPEGLWYEKNQFDRVKVPRPPVQSIPTGTSLTSLCHFRFRESTSSDLILSAVRFFFYSLLQLMGLILMEAK